MGKIIQSILDSIFTTTHIDSLNALKEQSNNILNTLKEQSVSVLNFGATGDGVTDDSEAIKTAILNSSGKTIVKLIGGKSGSGI